MSDVHQPWRIRRMLSSIDESLPYEEFVRKSAEQAMQAPREVILEGTRYGFDNLYLVPALEGTGTMIYTIAEFVEIIEVEP